MELTNLLERMRMEHLLSQLDTVCEQAAQGDVDYKTFLTHALEAEWRGRHQRGVENRLKLARFPSIKTARAPRRRSRWPTGVGGVERHLAVLQHLDDDLSLEGVVGADAVGDAQGVHLEGLRRVDAQEAGVGGVAGVGVGGGAGAWRGTGTEVGPGAEVDLLEVGPDEHLARGGAEPQVGGHRGVDGLPGRLLSRPRQRRVEPPRLRLRQPSSPVSQN